MLALAPEPVRALRPPACGVRPPVGVTRRVASARHSRRPRGAWKKREGSADGEQRNARPRPVAAARNSPEKVVRRQVFTPGHVTQPENTGLGAVW